MEARLAFVVGDATAPAAAGPNVIAHVCNDVGGWGRGFVVAISRRWPAPEADYRAWYAARANNDFALGAIRLVLVRPDLHRLVRAGVRVTVYDLAPSE
jgi:hypothetical protein